MSTVFKKPLLRMSRQMAVGSEQENCPIDQSHQIRDLRTIALTGVNFTGLYCFLQAGFYGLGYITSIFQGKFDATLERMLMGEVS